MKKLYLFLSILFASAFTLQAQNLMLNPGCDDTLVDGEIPYWQEISGNSWTQRCTNPEAYGGTCYFYAGAVASAELRQVIDISADSTEIDNGGKNYFFSGYVRTYSQSPPDESNIHFYFRDCVDTLLSTIILGPYNQTLTWLRVDSALAAPPGARKVDLRLHSVRHNGSNNDGYYDELYLGNSPLVGKSEFEKNMNFIIYPNPSPEQFTFEFSLQQKSLVNLFIINSTGQVLAHYGNKSFEPGQHLFYWNAKGRASGVYFARFCTDTKVITTKIIKKH